jgi:hypothetical protein
MGGAAQAPACRNLAVLQHNHLLEHICGEGAGAASIQWTREGDSGSNPRFEFISMMLARAAREPSRR